MSSDTYVTSSLSPQPRCVTCKALSLQGGGHQPTTHALQAGSMHGTGLTSDLQNEVSVGLGNGARGPTQARPHRVGALEGRMHAQAASSLCRGQAGSAL